MPIASGQSYERFNANCQLPVASLMNALMPIASLMNALMPIANCQWPIANCQNCQMSCGQSYERFNVVFMTPEKNKKNCQRPFRF